MTKRTINPQNWVSDEATIEITGNTVKVNGETLTLELRAPIFGDAVDTKFDFHAIDVMWDGSKFVTLLRFGKDTHWMCEDSGISREHADPAELAAIMACNLI